MPLFAELGVAPAPAPGSYDERHHNCSGKHAGFLAACVQHGWPLDNYLAPGHPLQQAIRRDVARAVGLAEALKIGIDGCSAPNYAMPLANLARGLRAPGQRRARRASSARVSRSCADAMTAHPDLVSGTGRNDLAFMRAGRGDWVTKVGAEGVQALASKSRAQAFAIKIADGNKLALMRPPWPRWTSSAGSTRASARSCAPGAAKPSPTCAAPRWASAGRHSNCSSRDGH